MKAVLKWVINLFAGLIGAPLLFLRVFLITIFLWFSFKGSMPFIHGFLITWNRMIISYEDRFGVTIRDIEGMGKSIPKKD